MEERWKKRFFCLVCFLFGFFVVILTAEGQNAFFKKDIEVKIPGLVCPSCAIGVKKYLKKNPRIEDIEFDIRKEVAFIECSRGRENKVFYPQNEEIIRLVKKSGYEVKYIKRLWSKKPNRYNKP